MDINAIASRENLVRISAAGAGKTWGICHDALTLSAKGKRSLIVTYTNRGISAIAGEIRKQNYGVPDSNVIVKSWYNFLLSDLIKPYQNLIHLPRNFIRSVDFSEVYGQQNWYKKSDIRHYMIGNNVRANNASELAVLINDCTAGKPVGRLEKIYTCIFFDEVQDLAGYDLELVRALLNSNIGITCVGDNKQATYSTHNTRKNKGESGGQIWYFFDRYQKTGQLEIEKNLTSRRFNIQICNFANAIFPVGDQISTSMSETSGHDGVFLITREDVKEYYSQYHPVVLRYNSRTDCLGLQAVNFGACKGETFDRVLIFSTGPLRDFILRRIPLSAPEKYYVAVTRPRYSIAIVLNSLPSNLSGFRAVEIKLSRRSIKAMCFEDRNN